MEKECKLLQFHVIFDVKKVYFKPIWLKNVHMHEKVTDFWKCIGKWRFIRICSSQKILMRTSFVFGGDFFSNLTLFRRVSSVVDKRFARMNCISNIWRQNYDFYAFFSNNLITTIFSFCKIIPFSNGGNQYFVFANQYIEKNFVVEPRANTLVYF